MQLTPKYVQKTVERAVHFITLKIQEMFSGYYTKEQVDSKVLEAKLDVTFELDESTGELYMVTTAENLTAHIDENGDLLITVDDIPAGSTVLETIDSEELETEINNILKN